MRIRIGIWIGVEWIQVTINFVMACWGCGWTTHRTSQGQGHAGCMAFVCARRVGVISLAVLAVAVAGYGGHEP